MTCPLLTTYKDINHSGDGGIHAQLLRNNGFQGENATLTAYSAVGGATLVVDFDNPLSQAIQRSLKVSVAEGATGQVGFSNEGYWGIQVNQARLSLDRFLILTTFTDVRSPDTPQPSTSKASMKATSQSSLSERPTVRSMARGSFQ